MLSMRNLSMRKLSWYQSLGVALLIFVMARWLNKSYAIPYLPVSLATMVLLLRYLNDWPEMLKQFRYGDHNARQWRVFVPPFLSAWWRYNCAACASFWTYLQRQAASPVASCPHTETRFTYLERGQYQTVFIIILLALFVEVPFSALMINLLNLAESVKQQAHTILLSLTLYSLFLLIADRQQLKQSCHQLFADHLSLRIGQRFAADLPLHLVVQIRLFKEDKRLWCSQQKVSLFDCQQVSPADAANVLIEVQPERCLMQSFKLSQPLPRFVFIYVDQPLTFVNAVQQAMLSASAPRPSLVAAASAD